MKKLIILKFIFLLTISFFSQKADKDYKLLIISKISGSFNPLGTDTEIEILKTSTQEDRTSPNYLEKVSMVKYFRPPGNIKYAAMGDQKLQITGFYPGTDKTIINCVGKNLVNYPVKSTITIYWLKNIIQVTEEDFNYGGLDYSALYNFKKILVQGENIKNAGKYDCLECNITAFCPTNGYNFKGNQVEFNINNEASKLQKWEFKEVEYTNTGAFGTLIGEGGLKLGQFSLNEEQFNFTLEAFENTLIKCKIKKNQEKLNKQKRVIESIELLLKDDQLDKAIKFYKDNLELLNFDFVNNRVKDNRAVKKTIGSYAIKTPYDGTISVELTNAASLIRVYQKNNLINVGKYELISDLNNGVMLKNEATKINLSNKPLYVQKEDFSRPWVGKINSTISKEVLLNGVSLSSNIESKMYKYKGGPKLNLFYVKNKKNEEFILSGFHMEGTPSVKKYHSIRKIKKIEYNSSLSFSEAQLIFKEKYKIDSQIISTKKIISDKTIRHVYRFDATSTNLEKTFIKYLHSNRTDYIEGIYSNIVRPDTKDKRYKVGVKKDSNKYKGVILETNSKKWDVGDIKFILEPTADKSVFSLTDFYSPSGVYQKGSASMSNDYTLVLDFPALGNWEAFKISYLKFYE